MYEVLRPSSVPLCVVQFRVVLPALGPQWFPPWQIILECVKFGGEGRDG